MKPQRSKLFLAIGIAAPIIGFFAMPICKWPTKRAMDTVEAKFIRGDLSAREKDDLAIHSHWIRRNFERANSGYWATYLALLCLSGIVIAQNFGAKSPEGEKTH